MIRSKVIKSTMDELYHRWANAVKGRRKPPIFRILNDPSQKNQRKCIYVSITKLSETSPDSVDLVNQKQISIIFNSRGKEKISDFFPDEICEILNQCSIEINFENDFIPFLSQIPFKFEALFYNRIDSEELRQKARLANYSSPQSYANYFFDQNSSRKEFLVQKFADNYRTFVQVLPKTNISLYTILMDDFFPTILRIFHDLEEEYQVECPRIFRDNFSSRRAFTWMLNFDNLVVNGLFQVPSGPVQSKGLFNFFLSRELYDPRILCLIAQFADDSKYFDLFRKVAEMMNAVHITRIVGSTNNALMY